jgi:hypothetical protein
MNVVIYRDGDGWLVPSFYGAYLVWFERRDEAIEYLERGGW